METMALTPGTAEAPALSQDTATTAPMAAPVATSGTQSGPGEFDLDAAVNGLLAMTPAELEALGAPAAPVETAAPPEETDSQDEPDPESEPEAGTETPVTPHKPLKIRSKDDFEFQVDLLRKKGLSLKEAVGIIEARNAPQPPAAAPEAAPAVPTVEPPQEVAALQAREAEITKELEEATALFDGARIAALTKELARLPLQIEKAERAAEARQAEAAKAQQAFDQAVQESEAAVQEMFPSLLNPTLSDGKENPAYRTYIEVAQSLSPEAQASPEFAMIAAVQAARKLGLAPAAPKSSSPSAAVPEPKAPMPARPRPASGNGAAPVSAVRPDYSKMSEDELDARVRAFVGS